MTLCDAGVILDMELDGTIGLILYDRSRSLAAAGMVEAEMGGGGGEAVRRKLDLCAMALLGQMLRRGACPGSVEVFALGPAFDSRWTATGRPTTTGGSVVSLAYGSSGLGSPRRVEFDVSCGRLVMEAMAGG
jgi:hypothetical protein